MKWYKFIRTFWAKVLNFYLTIPSFLYNYRPAHQQLTALQNSEHCFCFIVAILNIPTEMANAA